MGSESRARFLDYFKMILSELFGYFPEGSAVSYEKQISQPQPDPRPRWRCADPIRLRRSLSGSLLLNLSLVPL